MIFKVLDELLVWGLVTATVLVFFLLLMVILQEDFEVDLEKHAYDYRPMVVAKW